MAINNDLILTVYDDNGTPLPGLVASWSFCTNLDTAQEVTPRPTVTSMGNGVYRVARTTSGHVVGQIDFGATAFPRYFTYDVSPAAAVSSFTSSGTAINPVIAAVAAPRLNQVIVTFSEAVKMTTESTGALCLNNYSVAPLTILTAREMDERQVMLTTSAQLPATTYELMVYNVQDLYGNPISPA